MRGCSNCGQVNPGGFRFCGACGSPLADGPGQAAGEERKDVARTEAHHRQALELYPAGAPGRARVLARAARAAFQAGRVAEAAVAYQEAIDGFAAEGEVVGQGEALNRLSSVLWNQGEARRAREALLRAVALLEQARPGPELCSAYAQLAMDRVMSGHPQEALGWADKALMLADELGGLPEERLRALDSRGVARGDLGDLGGMDDLRAALELGLEVGAGYDTAVVYNNLIEPLWLSEGPAAALELCREAIEFTERRGLGEGTAWIRSATLVPLLDLGRWEEAVDTADALIAWERDHGGRYMAAWTSYGHQLERAHALLGAGRCLLALGRPEGQLRLREARTVVATLHAGALLSEADAP